MSTPLLAEANQSQGQDTAQGAPAQTDTQVQPEQKQAEAQTNAGDQQKEANPTEVKKDANQDKVEGAPELYEFELPKGLPESHQLDEQVVDSFAEIARELNLSQQKAQKLLDKVVPTIHRRALEQQAELHNQWREAVKADKTIGGQKLDENLAVAKRAVAAFGDSDLQQLLNGPLGSNPAILRMLYRAGSKVSQDKFIGGDTRGSSVDLGDEAAMARRLYPKSSS